MDNISIKGNLYKSRKSRNLTQEDVANMLGISVTAYREIEKGDTGIMNSNVLKMAKALDISTEELVLGYRPTQSIGVSLEDVRAEYDSQISVLEKKVVILEKLVVSLEETISSKNEIISMLKKRLGEDE